MRDYTGGRVRQLAAGSSLLVVGGLLLSATSAGAAGFCPDQFELRNGTCFRTAGVPVNQQGFSVAGLSSEVLSNVSQSLSQQATTATLDAVRERREQEVAACPADTERVRGICQPVPRSADRVTSAPRRQPRPAPSSMIVKALPPSAAPVAPGPSPAVWTQAFGDFEQRNHLTPGQPVDLGAKTTTWGVLAGVDGTWRNVVGPGDALIVGLLAGFTSSDVKFVNSDTTARVSGPSVGFYGSYANGGFSTDLVFKTEFFSLNQSFSEVLNADPPNNPPLTSSGSFQLDMTNYIVANNYNYRVLLNATTWIEPTAGFRYTQTHYGAGAFEQGFSDGHVFRLQGGARVGWELEWNGVHVTPVVTGLAYSDVDITGGAIVGPTSSVGSASFLTPTTFVTDEGKLRGMGIFTANFDYRNGFTTFAQAEVRGGTDYFGYGGRAGVRYQW